MTIGERLEQGSIVIMDGGTGTEIQRRGSAMDDEVWSGLAHVTDPEVVRRVHEDYIRAGAEVVIANTFSTSKRMLQSKGLEDRFNSVNRSAVQIAVQARENAAAGPVWVAGSISSMEPLGAVDQDARGGRLEDGYRRQAEVLAEAGADLIIAEMMLSVEGSLPVVRAALSVRLPVWVGLSASVAQDGQVIGYRPDRYESTQQPEGFREIVDEVLAPGVDVAGVMHSPLSVTGPALQILRSEWRGPTMAYAETGRFTPPTWQFEQAVSPDEYASAMQSWVADHAVQIVGGCCGTGPDHIRALAERFA